MAAGEPRKAQEGRSPEGRVPGAGDGAAALPGPAERPPGPLLVADVAGIPRPKGSHRAVLGRGSERPVVVEDSPATLRTWREQLAATIAGVWSRDGGDEVTRRPPYDGPVEVTLIFRLPAPRRSRFGDLPAGTPDVDKLARAVLDHLEGVVVTNDARVVKLRAVKRWADEDQWPPGVLVIVHEVEEGDVW